ncbi:DNA-3-methyladenine glycosylase I [Aquitalea sp. LB_tupeE]|uniref:DNA-3-methyladenine glycosylase I n=1 Tax=Aquitalea sp. LB_tupeE TaxID=2748078 RepID=UPI0015BCCD19|nr:DNA-3-methyladenine glycosylase I [Aquitalea sp. LB_tupeE]NWK80238.1 DNA-3-methyladenine glycosylase I [Aquitalea sp. LB_tupeE]
MTASSVPRCPWCGDDPLYIAYHDQEWGRPQHDDTKLFEMLILEGAQAGLSWITILRKREGYRRAFHGFDPQRVAQMTEEDVERLMQDSGIVRNRLKIRSTIRNAAVFLQLQQEHGSFDRWLWNHTQGQTVLNHWPSLQDCPASTPLSEQISKSLKKAGMNFVGSTVIYAYLQATGVVNDHLLDCHCHPDFGKNQA